MRSDLIAKEVLPLHKGLTTNFTANFKAVLPANKYRMLVFIGEDYFLCCLWCKDNSSSPQTVIFTWLKLVITLNPSCFDQGKLSSSAVSSPSSSKLMRIFSQLILHLCNEVLIVSFVLDKENSHNLSIFGLPRIAKWIMLFLELVNGGAWDCCWCWVAGGVVTADGSRFMTSSCGIVFGVLPVPVRPFSVPVGYWRMYNIGIFSHSKRS